MTARSLSLPEAEPKSSFQGTARPIVIQDKDISRFQSLISAPIKGIAKGLLGAAKFASFLSDPMSILYGTGAERLFKQAEEKIEEKIPTHPEALEKGLERTGRLGAEIALGGGVKSALGLGAKALAGGALGQTIEELGGSPSLQAIGEIVPSFLPSLARKIIPSNADQKKILEMGRRYGMTEEQLAPLMPEAGKRRFFGKYAYAGESAQQPLKETRQGIQNIYQILETGPGSQQILSRQATTTFANDVNQLTRRMPYAVRSQLKQDAADLVASAQKKGGVSGEDLMNFYHDISSRYNIGRSQLELLKNPIKDALHSIDPRLAKDFETVNRMYQKSAQIGRILRPSEYEHLISLGEAYEFGAAAATLDLGRLQKLLGFIGFRKFSEKMLTSPRLQNIIKKTQNAVVQNNLPAIKKLGDLLLDEFREEKN
jgi:hypothetical protein